MHKMDSKIVVKLNLFLMCFFFVFFLRGCEKLCGGGKWNSTLRIHLSIFEFLSDQKILSNFAKAKSTFKKW